MSGTAGCLTVQSDMTVLLEADHPDFEEARGKLSCFAELVKSPEHVHTYRITPLSLWNAAAAGRGAEWMLEFLGAHGKYPVPGTVRAAVLDHTSRYGKLVLRGRNGDLRLEVEDPAILARLAASETAGRFFSGREGGSFLVPAAERGRLKHALTRMGYPVRDLAGYAPAAELPFELRETARSGPPFALRDYQQAAVSAFLGRGEEGGSGVVTLPCGAGKTVVAMGVMARLGLRTLVLATGAVALKQWRRELLDRTTLTEDLVGEYSGGVKQVRPVTLATYQVLTHRPPGSAEFPHFALFDRQNWGLIVYDEVHLLPAPIFSITASLQAKRRLGLTATLVREDGKEDSVFSLIGPRKFDLPWKTLEESGWIAQAECIEVRVPFPEDGLVEHAVADDPRARFRLASENPAKEEALAQLLEKHRADSVLVIGQYLGQLRRTARRFGIPLLTGQSSTARREDLFGRFRAGEIPRLAVSSVANFAVDLPDANCAIQISGRFGSRQEEAQRLGRLLRPKPGANRAVFYTLVTRDSEEQGFARHRQVFLAEQGYRYEIVDCERGIPGPGLAPAGGARPGSCASSPAS